MVPNGLFAVVSGVAALFVLLTLWFGILLSMRMMEPCSGSVGTGAILSAHVAADMTTCPAVARTALDASTSGSPHMHGAVGVPQLRLLGELRACSAAAELARPNPRHVSNVLFAQTPGTPTSPLTALAWSFGQFIDHDIVLTRVHGGTAGCPAMHISTAGDTHFSRRGPIVVSPSVLALDTVTGTYHTLAGVTNFIDASGVYGSGAGRAYHLRAFVGGELRVGHVGGDETLPNNTVGLENVGGDANPHMFLAGDIRSSEQAPLAAWHTLWLREHNYQARRLAATAGGTDECLFQAARAIVIGELQRAVFEDFVPALLGGEPLAAYAGYRPEVDPRVSLEFAVAAYRFGHSMVNDGIPRANPATGAALESLPLRRAFMRPDALLLDVGLDELFAGAATTRAERVDARVVDALRQHLFEDEGEPLDLVAINIERGRELNVSDFAVLRAHFATAGWPAFSLRIPSDGEKLTALYSTSIDAYVGLLAEAPARDSAVLGRTLEAMVREQFTRLRDGDPRYYRALTGDHATLAYVESASGRLHAIIRRTTRVAAALLPAANVFVA